MFSTQSSHKTLILGIGNTLLSDEGIGIHVLHELENNNHISDDVEYIDGGTLSFTLADPIESSDQFIVIDACEINENPGSVRLFENNDMDRFITSGNKKSVHEVGLVDVMSIALLSGHLPSKRALIGIQPDSIDWGDEPTEAVKQAIPVACQQVKELLQRWKN